MLPEIITITDEQYQALIKINKKGVAEWQYIIYQSKSSAVAKTVSPLLRRRLIVRLIKSIMNMME